MKAGPGISYSGNFPRRHTKIVVILVEIKIEVRFTGQERQNDNGKNSLLFVDICG